MCLKKKITYLYIYVYIYIYVYLFMYLSFFLSMYLYVYIYMYCLSIYLCDSMCMNTLDVQITHNKNNPNLLLRILVAHQEMQPTILKYDVRICLVSINHLGLSGWWLGHPSEKYESQLG